MLTIIFYRSVILIAIIRQTYINYAFHHRPVIFTISNVVIATEVLLHCSIMAATIPCLKPFVMAFNTGWGQGTKQNGGSYYSRSGASGSHSASANQQRSIEEDEVNMIAPVESGGGSGNSWGIRRTREWTVHTELIQMQPVTR